MPHDAATTEARRPRLRRLAARLGLGVPDAELDAYASAACDVEASLARLAGLDVRAEAPPEPLGRPPAPREDPLGAWAWIGERRAAGAASGLLAGWRVAVKDNTCVAGLPMRAGSALLEGFVPRADARVVSRLLQAGAVVAGKSACEDLCWSGGSHTGVTGPVRHPRDAARMAGGSSGGSAVLVATGAVRAATGTDSGGSVMIPASWCGVVGVKPTHGLVPTEGVLPVEPTLDHVGLLARSVADAARMLAVMAARPALAQASSREVRGLRAALVADAFGWPRADPRVEDVVREAAARLARRGARVGEAPVPHFRWALDAMTGVACAGAARALAGAPGAAVAAGGHEDLAEALASGWTARASRLSPNVKLLALAGAALDPETVARSRRRARAVRERLRAELDALLARCDVLVLPTVPRVAQPFPDPADLRAVVRAASQTENTAPFNLAGHPTVTLPAGEVDGLPVGVTLAGRRGGERALLRAARAWESTA